MLRKESSAQRSQGVLKIGSHRSADIRVCSVPVDRLYRSKMSGGMLIQTHREAWPGLRGSGSCT